MIGSIIWGFVALVGIAALYDLTNKAITAWKPKPPQSTGQMLDGVIFAQQLKDLKNDMNALKVAVGFKKALGEKVEAK